MHLSKPPILKSIFKLLGASEVSCKTCLTPCRLAYDYNNLHLLVEMFFCVLMLGGWCLLSKWVPDSFMLVSKEGVYACMSVYGIFYKIHMCSYTFGSRILLQEPCRRPATWLWSDVIEAKEEAVVSNRVLGVSGSGVKKRRVERLMASLKWMPPSSCPNPAYQGRVS